MKSHRLPFENRWTGGERAWQWNCELERMGVANVRAMFADHELHHADDSYTRRQTLWLATATVLAFIAAVASVVAVLRT